MKLTIGEHIRRLRREKDMTQERLANLLGVTYQSVSRWENGTAYPDMELLPAISDIFSVSADELLGIPESEKEKQAQELCDEYCKVQNLSVPPEEEDNRLQKLADIIRQLRRDYAGCYAVWKFWVNSFPEMLRNEPLLSEVRLFAEERLKKCPGSYDVIQRMTIIEDDDKIEAFLNRYAAPDNIDRENLLISRYMYRKEYSKAAPLKHHQLFLNVDSAISDWKLHLFNDESLEDMLARNTMQLGILHAFAEDEQSEDKPISCGKAPDCWAEPRLMLGTQRAAYLAGLGRTEEAFAVLEDVVTLLEDVMKITERITFPVSRFIPTITFTAEEDWYNKMSQPGQSERMIFIQNSQFDCYCVYPSNILGILKDRNTWGGLHEYFDIIRNDPRYQNFISRVEALVITKDA